MQVHIDTLKISERASYTVGKGKNAKVVEFDRHTVEITIGDDRRAVACHPTYKDGALSDITIYGLAVRFSQGAKVWPGHATWWAQSGNVNNLHPNIDKSGHFFLAGYAADYDGKAVKSQHNAVA